MKLPLLFLAIFPVLAQTALEVPRLGAARDSSGRVRNLLGVGGAFLLSVPIGEPALSAAFSRQSSLIKMPDGVQVYRKDGTLLHQQVTADGPAFFCFDAAGNPAYAYVQGSRTLLQWDGAEFKEIAAAIEGEVQSIGLDLTGGWNLAVRRNGQTVRISAAGTVDTFAADVAGATLLPNAGALVFRVGEISLGGKTFEFEETPVSVEWINEEWLQIATLSKRYAMRIRPGKESLFRLPEVQ